MIIIIILIQIWWKIIILVIIIEKIILFLIIIIINIIKIWLLKYTNILLYGIDFIFTKDLTNIIKYILYILLKTKTNIYIY